jgi:hypothetical protein
MAGDFAVAYLLDSVGIHPHSDLAGVSVGK